MSHLNFYQSLDDAPFTIEEELPNGEDVILAADVELYDLVSMLKRCMALIEMPEREPGSTTLAEQIEKETGQAIEQSLLAHRAASSDLIPLESGSDEPYGGC